MDEQSEDQPERQMTAPADLPPVSPPAAVEGATVATRTRRAVALAIDISAGHAGFWVVGLVLGAAMLTLGVPCEDVAQALEPREGPARLVVGAVALLVGRTFAEGFGDATLGKVLCGIRVRRHPDLARCGWRPALIRSAAVFVDLSFFGLTGLAAMHDDPKCQRLGDVWAKTVVVRAADLATRRGGDRRRALGGAALGLLGQSLVGLAVFLA